MKKAFFRWVASLFLLSAVDSAQAQKVVQFEKTSAYHHIQVYDENEVRTLSFNGSWETTMSLNDPQSGHFEYTEYFQMPWLWNHDIHRVLMAGLGGGSTQRAYQFYYPNVSVDTVEIDPAVSEVAQKYFNVRQTTNHVIHVEDARVFLRRATNAYDVILMDAYSTTRYGSSLPAHLTTREFFNLANEHLTTNGVFAYNVIGQMRTGGFRTDVMGALYRTMATVFPHVYLFPATESQNVVMIGTKSRELFNAARVQREAASLVRSNIVTLPTFETRSRTFSTEIPAAAGRSPILTDNYAPIEALLNGNK